MSISKSKIKYICSLELKKNRKEEKVFVAEGPKIIEELTGIFHCRLIVATEEWLKKNPSVKADEIHEVSYNELKKVSMLKTPQEVLAVYEQPDYTINYEEINNKLILALDDIQDPGNLGTIVRLADWFGIDDIVCSLNTVDVYNPKTVQATMGGIARVKVHYTNLQDFLRAVNTPYIYGTFLEGDNIYEQHLSSKGIIVMGNEGNGISQEIKPLVTKKICIPNFPPERHSTESLNVAIATAITCAEFRRQNSQVR